MLKTGDLPMGLDLIEKSQLCPLKGPTSSGTQVAMSPSSTQILASKKQSPLRGARVIRVIAYSSAAAGKVPNSNNDDDCNNNKPGIFCARN